MEESRRFLRYIIPGLVFYIWLSFCSFMLFGIIYSKGFSGLIKVVPEIFSKYDIKIAAILLVFSGGFGYIFSAIHHLLYWRFEWYGQINHQNFLNNLIEKNIIVIISPKDKTTTSKEIRNVKLAWRIISVVWHELRGKLEEIKMLYERTTSLSDFMHSSGTTLVSAVFALILSIISAFFYIFLKGSMPPCCNLLVFLFVLVILAVLIRLIHYRSYKSSLEQCRRVVEMALFDILTKQKMEEKQPFTIHLDDIESNDK